MNQMQKRPTVILKELSKEEPVLSEAEGIYYQSRDTGARSFSRRLFQDDGGVGATLRSRIHSPALHAACMLAVLSMTRPQNILPLCMDSVAALHITPMTGTPPSPRHTGQTVLLFTSAALMAVTGVQVKALSLIHI